MLLGFWRRDPMTECVFSAVTWRNRRLQFEGIHFSDAWKSTGWGLDLRSLSPVLYSFRFLCMTVIVVDDMSSSFCMVSAADRSPAKFFRCIYVSKNYRVALLCCSFILQPVSPRARLLYCQTPFYVSKRPWNMQASLSQVALRMCLTWVKFLLLHTCKEWRKRIRLNFYFYFLIEKNGHAAHLHWKSLEQLVLWH